jgi:hypothetical protein
LKDGLAAELLSWVVIFLVVCAAMLVLGTLEGCAHTTAKYVDPARPEAHVEVSRTTFLRHGSVSVQFPINADVRIYDEPMGDNLTTTAIVAGALAAAVAGPAGAAAVLGGATLLGIVTAVQTDDEEAPSQEAPPFKPLERQSLQLGPIGGSWNQFACGGVMQPDWCAP